MEIAFVNEEQKEIQKGDFLVFQTEEGNTHTFVFGEDKDVVLLFSIAEGRTKYSIAKNRGFKELVAHAEGMIAESIQVEKTIVVRNQNVKIEFTI